jgi:hypothetical protein
VRTDLAVMVIDRKILLHQAIGGEEVEELTA